jgi:probable HAF family extracellular repeat protein
MFTGLGDRPGFLSIPNAVSADGSVVVGVTSGAGAASASVGAEAFRWTPATGMVSLGALAGDTYSTALAVSADGSVVVGQSWLGTGGPVPVRSEAFRWTPSTGMMGLGELPGGDVAGAAVSVSGDGSVVVGGSSVGPHSEWEAFRCTPEMGMASLGPLGGYATSSAVAVSPDGSAIVAAALDLCVCPSAAFLWTEGTGAVDLMRDAQIADVAFDPLVIAGTESGEAFRWTPEGGPVRLGTLPEPDYSFARSMSADGSVIVGEGSTQSGRIEGFVWDQAHGIRSLPDVLASVGLSAPGWELGGVHAISDDGLTIAGQGRNPQGRLEAWIAVLPEPSSGVLLGAGLARSGSVVEPRPTVDRAAS